MFDIRKWLQSKYSVRREYSNVAGLFYCDVFIVEMVPELRPGEQWLCGGRFKRFKMEPQKHIIVVECQTEFHHQTFTPMLDWIGNFTKGPWNFTLDKNRPMWQKSNIVLSFKSPEDAMLFKLTWV